MLECIIYNDCDLPANGLYFMTYEMLQDYIRISTGNPELGVPAAIVSGGLAGMSYWILGMPADVLKSRLQTAPEGKYTQGVRSVFKDLMKTEGPMALYKGVVPVMLRAFPANAACFFGIELANKFLSIIAPNF